MDKKQLGQLLTSLSKAVEQVRNFVQKQQEDSSSEGSSASAPKEPLLDIDVFPRSIFVPYIEPVTKIADGDVSQIISERPLVKADIEKETVILQDARGDQVKVKAVLAKSSIIYLDDFRKTQDMHGLSDDQRKVLWPRKKKLYATTVIEAQRVDDSADDLPLYNEELQYTAAVESPYTLTNEATICSANTVIGSAWTLKKALPSFAQQASEYKVLTDDQLAYIKATMGAVCVEVTKEYVTYLKAADLTPEPVTPSHTGVFTLSSELADSLKDIQQALPEQTRISSLTKDALQKLERFSDMAPALVSPVYEPEDLQKAILPRADILAGKAGPAAIFQTVSLEEDQVSISLDPELEPFGDEEDLYLPRIRKDFKAHVDVATTHLAKAMALPEAGDIQYDAVIQIHFIGKMAHTDIRIKVGDHLIGYTLLTQKKGKLEEVTTLKQAEELAKDFASKGSWWNKAFTGSSKIRVELKEDHPVSWMDITTKAFEPGEAGASKFKPGFLVTIGRPKVSLGLHTDTFHEYFLEDNGDIELLAGRLVFRLQASSSNADDSPAFWTASMPSNLVPAILQKKTILPENMPPQHWSYLPPGLKKVTPIQFRYWLSDDAGERAEIRDALFEEKFFTKSNIKIVDDNFERVVASYTVYKPSDSPSIESKFFKATKDPIAQAQLFSPCGLRQALAKYIAGDFEDPNQKFVEPFADNSGGAFFAYRNSKGDLLNMRSVEMANAMAYIRAAKAQDIADLQNRSWMGRQELFDTLAEQPPIAISADDTYKTLYLNAFKQEGGSSRDDVAFDLDKRGLYSDIPNRLWAVKSRLNETSGLWNYNTDILECIKEAQIANPKAVFLLDIPDDYPHSKVEDLCKYMAMVRNPFIAISSYALPLDSVDSKLFYDDSFDESRSLWLAANYDLTQCAQAIAKAAVGPCDTIERALYQAPTQESESTRLEFKLGLINEEPQVYMLMLERPGIYVRAYEVSPKPYGFSGKDVLKTGGTPFSPAESIEGTATFLEYTPTVKKFRLDTEPDVKKALPEQWQGTLVLEEGTILTDKAGVEIRKQERYVINTNPPPAAYYATDFSSINQGICKINDGDFTDDEKLHLLTEFFECSKGSVGVQALCKINDEVQKGPIAQSETKQDFLSHCLAACEVEDSTGLLILEGDEAVAFVAKRHLESALKQALTFESLAYTLLAKSEIGEERYIKGVVLVPNTTDAQGDIYDVESVRNAAHYFMEYSGALGRQHLFGLKKSQIRILESYLLDEACEVEGRMLPKGTWIMAARVLDDALWADIKSGACTGWSVEGSALGATLE